MPLSRRAFIGNFNRPEKVIRPAAAITARGREAAAAKARAERRDEEHLAPPESGDIVLNSNENPLGPGAAALSAILDAFSDSGRYPINSRRTMSGLLDMLAKEYRAKPENFVLGAGSTEILYNAARAFTSPWRGLVTPVPTFDVTARTAERMGSPVREIPLDSSYRLDLDPMSRAAVGAGLVFFCNPNNPTGTVHSHTSVSRFVAQVLKDSPSTVILIDEAYHEYVTEPSYRSAIPLALSRPGVVVSRTFSKAYGMAGLRVGYGVGHEETVARLSRFRLSNNVNVLAVAASATAFNDAAHIAAEKDRNTRARTFTLDFFRSSGFRTTDSQTNFIFVEIGRPAAQFREACEKHRVFVGRDFPPLEQTHARISIGTLEEMRRAVEVFRKVLTGNGSDAERPGK